MIKLAIFDMDGLMLDTEPIALRGWKIAEKELDFAIPDELFTELIGLNRELCKATLFENIGPFDFDGALKIIFKYVDDYLEENGAAIKPGLIYILDKLEKAGIKKCVATSTATTRAIGKLTQAGIVQRFDAIIGGDQVPYSKPAPDIFLKAAEACKTAPEHCVVFEDSNAGAMGGISAKMNVIIIPDLAKPTEFTQKHAFAICEDLFHAWEVVSSLAHSL